MTIHKVIIIGSGPAGCTAAIYAQRANLNAVVITGAQPGGQLTQTHEIENWPGVVSTSGFELMENLTNHAKKLGATFVSDEITAVDFSKRPFTLVGKRENYQSQSVIIATGASPKYLGLPAETKFFGKGVSACATCDGFFYRKQDVAVIGGGNTALIEALYLSNICSKVYLVHRRDTFRAEQTIIDRIYQAQKEGKIELVLNATLADITGTDDLGVNGIDVNTPNGKQHLSLAGVFIAIGHSPNTTVFSDQLETDHGIIVVGKDPMHKTATSVAGVFAAGDCADPHYRQAITSAGSGCAAALDCEKFLQANP